jgi:hypothetical protein
MLLRLNLIQSSPCLFEVLQEHGLPCGFVHENCLFLSACVIKVEKVIRLFLRVFIDHLFFFNDLWARDVEANLSSL